MTAPQVGVLVAMVAAVAGVLWANWRRLGDAQPGRRVALLVLRGLALACLAAMVANPVARRTVERESAPRLVVLADRSASMSLKDGPGKVSRFEWLTTALAPEGPVGQVLARSDGRCYLFAEAAAASDLPLAGAADGAATNLDAALRAAMQADLTGRPDAIVAITDGATNRGPLRDETVAWLAGRRVPVYCVGVGAAERPPDAWIARLDAPRVVKAGAACTVAVGVGSRGLRGGAARLTLEGRGLAAQARELALTAGKRAGAEFVLRLPQPGVYRCRVALGTVPGEWTRANNERSFFLRVVPGEAKLLLVGGSPSSELKFICRALESLAKVRVTQRVRKAGPGFGDPASPQAGEPLPTGRALNAYDAVMLQDVPASALGGAELAALGAFVAERGGGLGVLGGSEGFGRGGYGGTPLAPALGVRLGGASAYSTVPVKAERSPEGGDLPPVADIERNEDFPGWPAMPLLGGLNPVEGVSPGASVPLRTERGQPLLVVQRYGSGRTLCLLTGGTHRWVLSRDATDASRRGHGAFWRGIAAWLTTPPNRTPVALETDRDVYEVGQTARVVVQVTDEGFRPLSSAQVAVRAAGAGEPRQVTLSEVAGTPGRYEGGVPLTAPGPLRLTATATRPGSGTPGTDSREIAVESLPLELADPAQDVDFLRSLADASGGAYLNAAEVARLPELLRPAPHRERVAMHVAWARSAWLLAALLMLLACDWLLRRWWGVG